MKQVFLIDPLEKLNFARDSSLLVAVGFQKKNIPTYFLFEEDFFILNSQATQLKVYEFQFQEKENDFGFADIKLGIPKWIELKPNDCIHLRLNPPFDSRYYQILLLLQTLEQKDIRILNSAKGIMTLNGKIEAMQSNYSTDTFVGRSLEGLQKFVENLKRKGHSSLILKPLNQFQSKGIQKLDFANADFDLELKKYCQLQSEAFMAQAFLEAAYGGEIRAVYFYTQFVGSLKKIPKAGSYLGAMQFGGTYVDYEMTMLQRKICDEVAAKLLKMGIAWIGFDLIGDQLSEINILSPTALVELSRFQSKNLGDLFADLTIENNFQFSTSAELENNKRQGSELQPQH